MNSRTIVTVFFGPVILASVSYACVRTSDAKATHSTAVDERELRECKSLLSHKSIKPDTLSAASK